MSENSIYGKIYCRGGIIEAGMEFEGGRIKKIGKSIRGRKVKGLILPAAIDVHVHFRDFEERHKETIESGSLSAIHGGVCLVVDQPNCKPAVTKPEIYLERARRAEKKLYCDYSLNFALTKSNLPELGNYLKKIAERYYVPAVGEVFLEHSNPEMQVGYSELEKASGAVEKAGIRLSVHAEDAELCKPGTPNFLYRPEEAEVEAVKKTLEAVRCKTHICHVSSERSLELLRGSGLTCEVTPHHMLFSVKDYERLKDFVNVNPPLREKPLLERLNDVDIIASDHAPHTPEEKKDGAPGFPGVETMYPIVVQLIADGVLGTGAVEKLTSSPAKVFGFDRFGYGWIEEGMLANFAVFDLSKEVRISSGMLHSLCGWTPYEGFKAIFPSEVYLRGVRVIPEEEAMGRVLSNQIN